LVVIVKTEFTRFTCLITPISLLISTDKKLLASKKMESLITICALVLGWLLNEFGKARVFDKEQKGEIGIAILSFVEIHSRLKKSTLIPKLPVISKKRTDQDILDSILNTIIVEIDHNIITENYKNACLNVAKIDPLLGHKMYNIRDVLHFFEILAKHDTSKRHIASEMLDNVNETLSYLIPKMEESILELGSMHSKNTYKKLTKYFENDDMSIKDDELINSVASNYRNAMERLIVRE
jgi:hypothetical protein